MWRLRVALATETRFESEQQEGWGVLRPIGEVDAYWASRLNEHMTAMLASNGNRVIVDLAAVEFLDSTAIGVLMSGVKRARGVGGDLRLAGARPFVTRVLHITGLQRVFHSYASVPEATAAVFET
jgi:anti-sigma B factor antagonist